MNKQKTSSLIFLIISAICLILTYIFIDIQCSGWNVINPLCQAGNILVLVLKTILLIVFGFMFIISLIKLIVSNKTFQNLLLFLIFAVIAIVFWTVPDFLPLIDEFITTGMSIWYLAKTFKG